MESAWRKYLDMASGLTEVPRRKAEDAVKALVARGEVAANASEHLVDSLLGQVETNRKAVQNLVGQEVERALKNVDLVRKSALDALESRISLLERVRGNDDDKDSSSGSTSDTPAPAKKAAAKKSAKKATAKKSTAKKSTAAKSTAKKATAKKSTTAKKTAAKATAKKATAKKSTAKKSTAKKSTAKKSTAKKATPPAASGGDSGSSAES